MLPLAGSTFPSSPSELTEALRGGFAERGLTARDITTRGQWPALDLLGIDLTGCRIPRSQRIPSASGERAGGFTAATLELVGAPAYVESAPIHVSLRAEAAKLEFCTGEDGELLLMIRSAAQGDVSMEIARADLDRLVQQAAAEAARPHGVEVKSAKVDFTSRGARAVSLVAEVTAKMFIATATIQLSGDLDLDENLAARLSNLRFTGDGMVANLAGSVIRPQLARLEGATFPLLSFAVGEIRLHDIAIHAGETLRLTAKFGA